MMIVQDGVKMSGLCKPLKSVLPIIRTVYIEYHETLIIRGTSWGHCFNGEAHRQGHAIDINRPDRLPMTMLLHLKECLGLNFICKDLKHVIHIEYSPIRDHSILKQKISKSSRN